MFAEKIKKNFFGLAMDSNEREFQNAKLHFMKISFQFALNGDRGK